MQKRTRSAAVSMLFASSLLLVVGVLSGCGGGSDSTSQSSESSPTTTNGSPTSEGGNAPEGASKFPDLSSLAPKSLKPATKPTKIPVLIPGTQLLLQQAFVAGSEAAAKELNVETELYDAGGFENVSAQVSQFQNALGTHPDAVVAIPSSPEALNSQIKQARGEGIPVVASLIPPSTPVDYAVVDSLTEDAEKEVEVMAEMIGGEGKAYFIDGGAGGLPDSLFTKGVKAAIKKYPKLEIVFEAHLQGFNSPEAFSAAQDAFVKEPEVDAVITNQSNLAIAAYEALEQEGLHPVTGGYGPNSKEEIGDIRDGKLSVAIAPPWFVDGKLSMEWALALLNGQKPPQPIVAAPFLVLTKTNIDQAIDSGALFEAFNEEVIGCGPKEAEEC